MRRPPHPLRLSAWARPVLSPEPSAVLQDCSAGGLHCASWGDVWNALPNAAAQLPTRTTQEIPSAQLAANRELGPSSAYPLPAGPGRRPTAPPLDFQLDVTILRIESSRRSTMSDERYRPGL